LQLDGEALKTTFAASAELASLPLNNFIALKTAVDKFQSQVTGVYANKLKQNYKLIIKIDKTI